MKVYQDGFHTTEVISGFTRDFDEMLAIGRNEKIQGREIVMKIVSSKFARYNLH